MQDDNSKKFWINGRYVNVTKSHIPVIDNCGNEFVLLKLKKHVNFKNKKYNINIKKNKTEGWVNSTFKIFI